MKFARFTISKTIQMHESPIEHAHLGPTTSIKGERHITSSSIIPSDNPVLFKSKWH